MTIKADFYVMPANLAGYIAHLTRATYSPGSLDGTHYCKGQFQITVQHVTLLCADGWIRPASPCAAMLTGEYGLFLSRAPDTQTVYAGLSGSAHFPFKGKSPDRRKRFIAVLLD